MNIFKNRSEKFINSNELYRKYFNNKNIQSVTHFGTVDYSNINDKIIENLDVNYYIWKLGDTWETVARSYGINAKNWKVLALINNKPLSNQCNPGDTVIVPVDINIILELL